MDHHLGSFDDGGNGIALFQLEFVGAAPGYRTLDEIVSNPNDHMGHDIAELNFFDFAAQFVPGRDWHGIIINPRSKEGTFELKPDT